MAQRYPIRRSSSAGNLFGSLMMVIVVFLVLLLWYFKGHQSATPVPPSPPGLFHQP